ncbi:UNVERIFIED_CONTAM: hypothetical protein NCL1_15491 [Trichonephila clavipes]
MQLLSINPPSNPTEWLITVTKLLKIQDSEQNKVENPSAISQYVTVYVVDHTLPYLILGLPELSKFKLTIDCSHLQIKLNDGKLFLPFSVQYCVKF